MTYSYKELKRASKLNADDQLRQKRVAILGDTATQCLRTSIVGEAYLRGYALNVFEADYNQIERLVLNQNSELYSYHPDYTIIFQSTHKLLEHYNLSQDSRKESLSDIRLNFIKLCVESIPGRIIYYNYPEIDDSVFGSFSNSVASSFLFQLRTINYELMKIAQQNSQFFICDRRNFMYDAPVYMNTEMLVNLDALPLIASRTVDIIAAAEGRFKKCLILDLDNTLWGGVVGDDGWEGIQIGHDLGDGKAFVEFQHWIKNLKERGIILAVCSKNDDKIAREPFEKNPEMVLKLDDIAIFIANWENKADNIRNIQRILNIGFDSMVFLDDNPFERNQVRLSIPEIVVPELPKDPSDYLEYMYSLNLFETVSYNKADQNRTKQYQIEAQRISSRMNFSDESAYLKSLDMVSTVSHFNRYNIPRVAQLSQRSNQFNLRTIRYTEEEILSIAASDKYVTLAFTLSDKFGDNGLISVVILEKQDTVLFINTWFMSCRVLKRGMENFALNEIVTIAKQNGFMYIIGEYLPTAKNGIVARLYDELGFTKEEGTPTAQYKLCVSEYKERVCYIKK